MIMNLSLKPQFEMHTILPKKPILTNHYRKANCSNLKRLNTKLDQAQLSLQSIHGTSGIMFIHLEYLVITVNSYKSQFFYEVIEE